MINIYIDKKKYIVNEKKNLLEVCLSLGLDIPYFCWHPSLGSIGSCRQCAVKKYNNFNELNGQIVMSCMTNIKDNDIFSINDKESKYFRKNVIEYLMINHPHDCPVCEEGGKCHLQDMTVMNKHYLRRYRFKKRTHKNQNLGPFISHNMNRCITCYRCVRFYKDYAGGDDFNVYGFKDNIYFGRIKDGKLKNEFSCNLIEICPTGVFGDKIYSKNYNRKWDMQFSPSICHQCSVGCNISIGGREGILKNIENRYNSQINSYFLCDRGKFGFEYINNKNNIKYTTKNKNNIRKKINKNEAIEKIIKIFNSSKRVIGIASPRASIESNFSLLDLVGYKNFFSGVISSEHNQMILIIEILKKGGIKIPSLKEIETYDTILILGEDLTNTSPRIALSVRQAIQKKSIKELKENNIELWDSNSIKNFSNKKKNLLFITNTYKTKLDKISSINYYSNVSNQSRLGFAISNYINKSSPNVTDIDNSLKYKVKNISQALLKSKKPLIISGMHSGDISIMHSAYNIAKSLKINGNDVGIVLIPTFVNSLGLASLGGKSLDDALNILRNKKADGVIIVENDLYSHQTKLSINRSLLNIKNVILMDHLKTYTYNKSNLTLPVSNFAQSSGTVMNYEGRAQRFFKCLNNNYKNNAEILSSWKILNLIKNKCSNKKNIIDNLDQVINKISKNILNLKNLKKVSQKLNTRFFGQKLSRTPNRYSGISSMYSLIDVNEQKTPEDLDTMFSFSVESNNTPEINRKEISFTWYPGWNSSHSLNKFQKEINGNLKYGNPGLHMFIKNNKQLNWFNKIPSKIFYKKNKYKIIAFWDLFGSDETSRYSKTIKNIIPKSCFIFNKNDLISMKYKKNSLISLYCLGEKICLPVKFSNEVNLGCVGLYINFKFPKVFLGSIAKNFLEY